MRPVEIGAAELDLLVADEEPKPPSDLSTPRAAAQAHLDLRLREELLRSRMLQEAFGRSLKALKPLVEPAVLKGLEEKLAKAVERGRARMKELKGTVERVEERGDRGTAVVSGGAIRALGGVPAQERLTLVKAGGAWRVDAAEHPCWSCRGDGKCPRCKGTGEFALQDCFSCKKAKTCSGCAGSGWQE
jgi:hypothetical protein